METKHQKTKTGAIADSSTNRDSESGFLAWVLPDRWGIPYVALLAYMFAIVTQRFPIGTAAIIIGLVSLVLTKQRLRTATPLNWMVVYLAWSSIGYLTSDYRSVVADELYTYLKIVLIAFLTVNAIRTRKQALFFLVFASAWYLIYPIRVTLLNYFVLGYTQFGRAVGPGMYTNSNDLAALTLLQMSAVFALSIGLRQNWARWSAVIVGLAMAVVIILTQSRGVFMGGIVLVALIIRSSQKKAKIMLWIIVALGLITMIVPASTFERFERLASVISGEISIENADEEGSARERSKIYRIALMIGADHPITGVGLGSYSFANAEYNLRAADPILTESGYKDAHSTYLSILAETGVPGLAIILLMFSGTLRSVNKTRKTLIMDDKTSATQLGVLMAGFLGFLVAALVGTYTMLAITYVHLCAIWAFSESLRQNASADKSVIPTTITKPVAGESRERTH